MQEAVAVRMSISAAKLSDI